MAVIKKLGLQPYTQVWEKMRAHILEQDDKIQDEIWIVQHFPVFTQGKRGRPEHIRHGHDIPIILSDRGGLVTYHGPGQVIIYFLLNLYRLNLGIRSLLNILENSVINLLKGFSIEAYSRLDAPGVYVNFAKIASIGLRVRKGFTYHGLAFNYKMDLTPFSYIDPCGDKNMQMTQLVDLLNKNTPPQDFVEDQLISFLMQAFNDSSLQTIYTQSISN